MGLPRRRLLRALTASVITASASLLVAGLVSVRPVKADSAVTVDLETLLQWHQKYSNWGRWGADDQKGTLNFITPRKRVAAGDMVKLGISVTMARRPYKVPIDPQKPFDPAFPSLAPQPTETLQVDDPNPFFWWANPPAYTSDRWNVQAAGIIHSHLDALCHTATPASAAVVPRLYPERMSYNGRPLSKNNTARGCVTNGIEVQAEEGIFTKGILFDATLLGYLNEGGNPWLAPGTRVTRADIERLEGIEGVTAEPGDVILLYTGHFLRRAVKGAWPSQCTGGNAPPNCGEPGFWYDNIPYFYERSIAQFGSDAWNDVTPATGLTDYTTLPYHGFQAVMGIVHYDVLDLEALAQTTRRLRKWEFLFTAAPFPVVGGATSILNPMATF